MENPRDLTQTANQIRQDIIEMLLAAGSGHSGGSLGMADVFTALYFKLLKHNPKDPDWSDRDRVILSNGHICPVWYAALAEAGYFPKAELGTLRKINTRLQGHPHYKSAPGVENTAGPLGQGISQACGLALGLKMDKNPGYVICLTSDGEYQEGQTWESYLFAAKYALSNLIVFVDRNGIQIDGRTEDIMPLASLNAKLSAFNWHVQEIDGHDFTAIETAYQTALDEATKPSVIICNTIPGKGVSFMENDYRWHGKAPDKNQAAQALAELRQNQVSGDTSPLPEKTKSILITEVV